MRCKGVKNAGFWSWKLHQLISLRVILDNYCLFVDKIKLRGHFTVSFWMLLGFTENVSSMKTLADTKNVVKWTFLDMTHEMYIGPWRRKLFERTTNGLDNMFKRSFRVSFSWEQQAESKFPIDLFEIQRETISKFIASTKAVKSFNPNKRLLKDTKRKTIKW